ncbi:hypothetical protein DH2020_044289 [Rehmannia glutinosa]|uniref:Uncharacterized protein n=1 Tax=Rehmannia glutinosa TaxID=99300 RepID=A0ABR0UI57_REHGL
MAGTSISSQLQAIKTILNVSTDPEPGKRRPITRPSILFDAKAAADIDLDTIFNIALSGLEVLITMEERFRNYKNDLFSYQSKELDRELVGQEENKRINASIGSYLRLLSGHLELHSALKTLEYLIRRYKYAFCLYASTLHFQGIFASSLRISDTNTSYLFNVGGAGTDGSSLMELKHQEHDPRDVIVQQCIRDMGVLEAICNYASPAKKIQPSKPVIGFCTAVVFEVLGLVNVDSDTVRRILPYVNSALQPGARGMNQKAGALMIVSLLAQKAALAPNVVKSLLHLVADVARAASKERGDLQWLRMSFMTVISIVQGCFEILSGLTKVFNIDKFLAVFLESLLEHSRTLLSIIETVPMKDCVNRIVFRLLSMRIKISQGKINLVSSESGGDSKVSSLGLGCRQCSEEKTAGSKKFDAIQDALVRRLYDDDLNVVLTVLSLKNLPEILSSSLLTEALEYVLQRCIEILLPSEMLFINKHISPDNAASLCLQQVITSFKDLDRYATTLATTIFPLLLIRPQTQKSNLKALESAKELKWPFYENIASLPGSDKKLDLSDISSINVENVSKLAETFSLSPEEYMPWLAKCCNSHELSKTLFFLVLFQSLKIMQMGKYASHISCLNISPATFVYDIRCGLSKAPNVGRFSAFFDSCFPIVKNEWEMLESLGISAEQSKKRILDGDCKGVLEDLYDTDIKDLNAEILACLFLRLSEAFIATAPEDVALVGYSSHFSKLYSVAHPVALNLHLLQDMKGKWVSTLQDLFVFFVCHSKDVFKKHLEYLSTKCKISLTQIMLKLFTEEGIPHAAQIESLQSFSNICSQFDEGSALQLLADFPSVLVPLSSDNQNVRVAAMKCIEELFALWSRMGRNGNNGAGLHFLGELLCLIIQQKMMILSDKNVLTSFFTTVLSSSSESLLVQRSVGKRFDESTKNDILVFMISHALGLPAHAKLKILSLIKGVGSKLMSVSGVRSLLNDLLESRRQYYLADVKLCHKLSQSEVDILCLLLEVNGAEDSVVLEPCMTILRNLSSSLYGDMKVETQELIFLNLLVLFRNANAGIHNASRDTLLRVNLNCSIVGRVLDSILDQETCSVGSAHGKKRKRNQSNGRILSSNFTCWSLFKLLHLIFMDDEWMLKAAYRDKACMDSSGSPQAVSDTTAYIQQTLLLTLEDIIVPVLQAMPLPWDSYSQRVFEGLISAIYTCWLSRTNNADQLLQDSGRAESLGSLLFLLFRSLTSRKDELDKLRDPELSHKLGLEEDFNNIQTMVGELMEQVVYHLNWLTLKKKHIGVGFHQE